MNTDLPKLVIWLDECPPDVAIFDQPLAVWQSRFQTVTNGSRNRRVRHRHDHIGIDRSLAGEFAAHALAHIMDHLTFQHRVRAGEGNALQNPEYPVSVGESRPS